MEHLKSCFLIESIMTKLSDSCTGRWIVQVTGRKIEREQQT